MFDEDFGVIILEVTENFEVAYRKKNRNNNNFLNFWLSALYWTIRIIGFATDTSPTKRKTSSIALIERIKPIVLEKSAI